MNCKPGDLAVTVLAPHNKPHKYAEANIGRIVEVLRYVGEFRFARMPAPTPDVWACRAQTKFLDAFGREWSGEVFIADANLRPIRDADGADETLSWKQVPAPKKKEHA